MAPGTRRVPGALRYAQLEDWESPTALYLVEKGTPQGTWLIARPALIKSQEWPDAREVAIPEADGEVIVYGWVKLKAERRSAGSDAHEEHLRSFGGRRGSEQPSADHSL